MAIKLNKRYKTIDNEIVKALGASVLNCADTGIIEKTDSTVILVHCEIESGESQYWLDWQLVEESE